ncbi:MAG: cytochrome c oxidase subunit 3 family protein [Chromatiaceae bacterium]|nr:cytochrome c oxidase subunit 3 family protein [Gammaproteobacteria bacterium]MCP5305955.1 cytochrome c oxidase subunit 3 family protein [Chromatiaceae bacterium]MCP5312815.1 cytochrome c oxidase subunit 3 family protein [Chromatiaceae bacterium]
MSSAEDPIKPQEVSELSSPDEATGTRYPPGDLAIWIFILAELLVFAVFFASYAFTRLQHVELFNHYQSTLNRDAALINTLALLTSSYFVVRGVVAAREGDNKLCARWLWAAVGMGGLFLVVKSAEYAHHIAAGVNLSTNTFYMFYLSLTFFHFMHVILGMVILAAVAVKARRGGYSRHEHTGVETGASYWHMVDLVWLILFPLVYVMR